MKNTGAGRFQDVSRESGPIFQVPFSARGAAFGDLDNDGSIDIVINCNNGRPVILRNQGNREQHWLLVNLIGTKSNRDGIGAKLRLVSEDGSEQHAFASTSGSYVSANDKRVHFGLGKSRKVKLLEITWPSGIVQPIESIAANQILPVREPAQ
jgi:hypothetical protein